MTNNSDDKPKYDVSRDRRGVSWGPLVPIVVIATIFLAVNDYRSDVSERRVRAGEATFSDSAFLGGIQRRYDSAVFREGEASAFMGGIDLDFRDAIIEGDEARLEVSAVMGGVKIRVPRTWNVDSRVVTTLGGMENRTRSGGGNKRLVVSGSVLMGGLEIVN
jgi:predicted membrane protein